MPKLHHVIAVEKNIRAETDRTVTDLHRESQKSDLMTGLSRVYAPAADDAYVYPGEARKVQLTANDCLAALEKAMTRHLDVTLIKDEANTRATADVVVDGTVLLAGVPVTYLMFLEKVLTDVRTYISKLPVLDPAESWTYSDVHEHYVSVPAETVKTRKVPRNHVKAEATPQHPAQVEVYHEDIPEGKWTTTKFSGALPAARKSELLARLTTLQHAVKDAHQDANATEVRNLKAAGPLFGYLLMA